MSSKEALIEWIRQLPDEYALGELLNALRDRYVRERPPQTAGKEEGYEWPVADLTEDEWRQVVAHSLQAELSDPREDIYFQRMESRRMNKGEIHLAKFPLGGTVGVKVRPVLLLSGLVGPVPELVTAYISSVLPTPLLPSDLLLDPELPEHAQTNLTTVSVVRLHKLATLHQRDVFRRLGLLSPATMSEIDNRLRALFTL